MKAYTQMFSDNSELVARTVALAAGIEVVSFGNFNTLYFVDERGLKVAFIYNRFSHGNVALHMAARKGAMWGHPHILHHVFYYPFVEMGCHRITAPIESTNIAMQRVAETAGFVLEGVLRRAGRNGSDLCIYGMLKEDCRWILNSRAHNEPSRDTALLH